MEIVRTKSKDGIHFEGLLSEPEGVKENIIVHIHGMAGDPYTNTWYPYFHKLFPRDDIAFLAGNHRGTGSVTMFFQEPDKFLNVGDTFETMDMAVEDIETWVQFAKDLGYKNIHIESHSLAPSKVAHYVSKINHDYVKSLIMISPVDMLGSILDDKEAHEKMLSEAEKHIKNGKENAILSDLLDGEMYISAKTYIDFFREDSDCNVFNYTGRDHDWSVVNNIDKAVLAIGGTKDSEIEHICDSKKALSILKKQLTSSPKVETKVYEGATHDFAGFEKEIVNEVIKFLEV